LPYIVPGVDPLMRTSQERLHDVTTNTAFQTNVAINRAGRSFDGVREGYRKEFREFEH